MLSRDNLPFWINQEEDNDPADLLLRVFDSGTLDHLGHLVDVAIWKYNHPSFWSSDSTKREHASVNEVPCDLPCLLSTNHVHAASFSLNKTSFENEVSTLDTLTTLQDVQASGHNVFMGHAFNVPDAFIRVVSKLIINNLGDDLV